MALGFAVNKGLVEIALGEISAVAGLHGVFVDGLYIVDAPYSDKLSRLAFTKEIYKVDLTADSSGRGDGKDKDNKMPPVMQPFYRTNKKILNKKLVINLNRHNKYMDRRSHLLPAGHPSMTHPKLARAMVNLSRAKKGIYDPFCGAGGILIEAGLIGLGCIGSDIDKIMLRRAIKNMAHLGLRKCRFFLQDASGFNGKYEAVVTDLPYGRLTKVTGDIGTLYSSFLSRLASSRIKKAVIGFPDFVDFHALLNDAGIKRYKAYSYYLHKNLSKIIVVFG